MQDPFNAIIGVLDGVGRFFLYKFYPSLIIPLFGLLFGFTNLIILKALLILVIFDFITGVLAAKTLKVPIRSKGIVRTAYKIAMYGLLVSSAHLTEQVTPGNTFIENAVITFLAITELISIIENTGKMGFAIPKKLLKKLQSIRDEEEQKEQESSLNV